MKRRLLVTLLILCAASFAEAQQSVRTTIETNTRQFVEAFNKGDAAAVANLYTMDARLLPPNAEMVQGRANIQKFWQGAITAGLKMVSLETEHVETQGNLAVEVGLYTTTIPAAGGVTTTDKGKYVVAWKREGRSWKLAVDIFNSNMPGATAIP
ncbi:MAG: YybH family protein [Pyrinomonadaceae bacterium]